jgi:hypothetical protein
MNYFSQIRAKFEGLGLSNFFTLFVGPTRTSSPDGLGEMVRIPLHDIEAIYYRFSNLENSIHS